MIVSSRKLIKSQNLIRVNYTNTVLTNEERDFLIRIFDKYFNGMHKNIPISEENLYCIMFDIDRFYEHIQFDKDFYIFRDRPINDL